MKERPILFSAPMVRAILECRKTQTRRVVKGCQFIEKTAPGVVPYWRLLDHPKQPNGGGTPMGSHVASLCPYGKPGDRLWVREAFSGPHCMDASDGCKAVPPSKWGDCSRIWYWADGNPTEGDWTRPRPSIHMPRWASRILLEVTSVRVEQLQDISESDAMAEGVERVVGPTNGVVYRTGVDNRLNSLASGAYAMLWEQINGNGSWGANPWVWVIEFNRMMP